jgi:hypothetical protein
MALASASSSHVRSQRSSPASDDEAVYLRPWGANEEGVDLPCNCHNGSPVLGRRRRRISGPGSQRKGAGHDQRGAAMPEIGDSNNSVIGREVSFWIARSKFPFCTRFPSACAGLITVSHEERVERRMKQTSHDWMILVSFFLVVGDSSNLCL